MSELECLFIYLRNFIHYLFLTPYSVFCPFFYQMFFSMFYEFCCCCYLFIFTNHSFIAHYSSDSQFQSTCMHLCGCSFPTQQAILLYQLGILSFNSILPLSTQRQHQILQVEGSDYPCLPRCQSQVQVAIWAFDPPTTDWRFQRLPLWVWLIL